MKKPEEMAMDEARRRFEGDDLTAKTMRGICVEMFLAGHASREPEVLSLVGNLGYPVPGHIELPEAPENLLARTIRQNWEKKCDDMEKALCRELATSEGLRCKADQLQAEIDTLRGQKV
jgi:hypothetical protein